HPARPRHQRARQPRRRRRHELRDPAPRRPGRRRRRRRQRAHGRRRLLRAHPRRGQAATERRRPHRRGDAPRRHHHLLLREAKLRTIPLLLLLPAVAHADPAGEKVMGWVDEAQNRAKSHYFEYEATTVEPGHADKKLGINVWIQGDKRVSEFTAPADLKGTKVLILSTTEMYAYLPAFGKVRRIASHTNDQSAFGMVFSQD